MDLDLKIEGAPTLASVRSLAAESAGAFPQACPISDAESLMASSEPQPDDEVEDAKIATYLRQILHSAIPAHRPGHALVPPPVGSLADAFEDYLGQWEG